MQLMALIGFGEANLPYFSNAEVKVRHIECILKRLGHAYNLPSTILLLSGEYALRFRFVEFENGSQTSGT